MRETEPWKLIALGVAAVAGLATCLAAIFKPDVLFPPEGRKITRHDMLVFLVGRKGARVVYIVGGLAVAALCAYLLADNWGS